MCDKEKNAQEFAKQVNDEGIQVLQRTVQRRLAEVSLIKKTSS